MGWGGGILCPGPQRQKKGKKKNFRAPLAPKLVVPHCSPLVWLWGVGGDGARGRGSGPTHKPPPTETEPNRQPLMQW